MFSRPKILFLVSLLFVALLNPKFNPYLPFKFLIFYHSSVCICSYTFCSNILTPMSVQDSAFRNDVSKSSETLANQVAKVTSPEQIDQLVRNHIDRLKAVEELADEERRRQMSQLQEILAAKRKKALTDLQQAQEEQVS